MSPNLSLVHEQKKFMWDGVLYGTHQEAVLAAEAYQKNNFEVFMSEDDGKVLLYTRKVIQEVVVPAH
ncbi:MAG TPA: hypothetical protein VMI10_00625 [Terriglobales bacterium]|nr:hypothetical protein [Terriglobales bacterium]